MGTGSLGEEIGQDDHRFGEAGIGVYLWIGAGSALGGMARHGCAVLAARYLGDGFPWGTLIVNVAGSFAIGVIAALTEGRGRLGEPARYFLMAGFCGGFTTFSAFSLQTLALLQNGAWAGAAANVLFSVLLCLLGAWLGYASAIASTG